ncbi:MAG: AIR synthase related protein [Candidatus Hodarchaeales archaeon]|jgi:hydrogenase maturation factor
MDEGKVPWDLLEKITSLRGYKNPGVLLGPGIGQDVAVISLNEAIQVVLDFYNSEGSVDLIYKADPITFPTPSPGRYAVIVNSNDVVTVGAIPYGFTATIIVPPGESEDTVLEIQKEIHKTCSEKHISLLGGHSEISDAVSRPIVSGSMIGFVPREYRVPRKIEQGDQIVCSGWVGAEGTGILTSEGESILGQYLSSTELRRAAEIGENIDIAEQTLEINKIFRPRLIHDATEGGILGAIYETIMPLGYGAKLSRESFPLSEETGKICDILKIDPLKLISSGCVLFISDPETCDQIVQHPSPFPTAIVGTILEKSKKISLDSESLLPPKGDDLIFGLQRLESMKQSI